MSIGTKIKELRKSKKLSQAEFGKRIGVSQTTVTAWETGRAEPASSYIASVADYFNVTTDYLLGRDVKEENSADTKDLQKFLEVNRKGMSFGDDPITDEQREKLDIALKMIFEKYKDKR